MEYGAWIMKKVSGREEILKRGGVIHTHVRDKNTESTVTKLNRPFYIDCLVFTHHNYSSSCNHNHNYYYTEIESLKSFDF